LSYKIRGAAPRQEIRRPAPESRSKSIHKQNRRGSARLSAVDHPDARPFAVRNAAPPPPPWRARPGGFAVYAFLVFAAFYLVGHVAVAAIGWRGAAICAGVLLYVGVLALVWAAAANPRGGRS